MQTTEITHAHLYCGLGGGAKGFNRGHARVGNTEARFRCIGGIDNDANAIRDFTRAAGTQGTVMDLFSREQYEAFHGQKPPVDWREATPADIVRAFHNERPNIVFLSAPCKGFSGLLSQARSGDAKYQALNSLTLRGIFLTLEAYKDDPPDLFLFENVPRIANRGRPLLDQITALLEAYGYAVAETTHDCGELGELAQSRRRFLLVARHQEKVPPFLYEPVRRPLRGVGDILSRMALPGDPDAGPMHRVPRLQWKTWVRLAFVEAGSDWRSLRRLEVEDGQLSDYLIVPEAYADSLGVTSWSGTAGTVSGRGGPTNGRYSVADPRFASSEHWNDGQQLGVVPWSHPMGTITGQQTPAQGRFSVADPRPPAGPLFGKYAIVHWDGSAGTVIGGDDAGAYGVADPRPSMNRNKGDHYLTGGHYGVVPWNQPSYAVAGAANHDNGPWSIADPRVPDAQGEAPRMPEPTDKLVAVIQSLDNTWHRPFTTLELAALQGLFDPEERFQLEAGSDRDHRERIGNAVPPPAAEAIAGVMGETLLLAWAGETFVLGQTPIWVRPIAEALTLPKRETIR